jgi:AcrR family transcriptional regulator
MTSSAVPGDTPEQQPGAGLRADAERNRCLILAAARRLYARAGLGVSMASIAREAGVGQATLSRRFPTKDDLVAAVFAERMDAYTAAVTEALADSDPWHGFTGYLHAICAMQAADRGFADVLTMAFPTAKTLEARRAEAYDRLLELITRAKNTGHLRDDFTHQDVVILLIANAGVVTATGDAAPDTWRRLVAHMIRSYAAPGAPIPPLPQAPPPTALYRAMVRLSRGPGTA